jgi:uncharacterized protein
LALLIDGHNLIGQMTDLSLADPDDEAKLVQRLKIYRTAVNMPITVIFDPGDSYTPPHDLSGGGVEVVFAGQRMSADRLIISRIRRATDPGQLTVVSSDQEIVDAARRCGAHTVAVADFIREMARSHGPRRRRPKTPKLEQRVPASEVNEWLALFAARKKPKK